MEAPFQFESGALVFGPGFGRRRRLLLHQMLDPPAQDIGRFAPGWQKDEDTLSVQRFAFLRRCEAAAVSCVEDAYNPEGVAGSKRLGAALSHAGTLAIAHQRTGRS